MSRTRDDREKYHGKVETMMAHAKKIGKGFPEAMCEAIDDYIEKTKDQTIEENE